MTKQSKQNFLQGALILLIANLIVKVIGMLYRIPLAWMLEETGMGYYSTAYTMYTFMFAVATAGFPVVVSKMVSESVASNNKYEAQKVFYISLVVLGAIGLIGSAMLYIFAEQFAALVGNPGAAMCIKAIAPAVFFVAIMSACRGFFQGNQNMYPTAFSEVIESTCKLVAGLLLVYMLLPNGYPAAASGAMRGVTLGTVLCSAYLLVSFGIHKRKTKGEIVSKRSRSSVSLAKELIILATPVTIGACISSLTNVIDMFTIMNRLQVSGVSEGMANELYGAYTGYAVTMFNFPLTLITALAMAIVPAVAGSLKSGYKAHAAKTVESSLRITLLFGLPCAAGLSLLAEPILLLVFNKTSAAPQLQILAIAVVFVSFLSVTNAVLQAYGRMMVPVVNMIIGGVVKVILNYVFIPINGINAAPVSTNICYLVIVALNLAWIIHVSGVKLSLFDFWIRPVLATVSMGICVLFVYGQLVNLGISVKLACLIAASFGAVIYGIMIFVFKALRREELELLPKGDKLVRIFEKIHFIR
ncbi:MAG: polysaccharide biosynthesis protein [Eubacteriales bacterium]|nr:polysaccharide biosynthesis protein [Eubacteriales bacterium]